MQEVYMPHRHWFVVFAKHGVERRSGPYASRKTAAREAEAHYKLHTSDDASMRLIYDLDPPPLAHSGRN
jgi:hypothetical protein